MVGYQLPKIPMQFKNLKHDMDLISIFNDGLMVLLRTNYPGLDLPVKGIGFGWNFSKLCLNRIKPCGFKHCTERIGFELFKHFVVFIHF